jgi:hypothetical protein
MRPTWVVRDIEWCFLCGVREVNGPEASECARCKARIDDALKRLEEAANG